MHHPMLNIGIRAAHAAGDLIVRYIDRIEGLDVNSKGRNDFVSEVDKQAETIIIDHIQKAYPNHGILAEESGKHGDDSYQWVIDPLDGTTNFLHGFPQFAVSIALRHKGILDQAVIYDPLRQELFTASKGAGAHLNNRRIRVSKQTELEGALLGTGFPYGKLDGFWEFGLKEWDIAAGALLVREAGGIVSDIDKSDNFMVTGNIVAGNLKLTDELLKNL